MHITRIFWFLIFLYLPKCKWKFQYCSLQSHNLFYKINYPNDRIMFFWFQASWNELKWTNYCLFSSLSPYCQCNTAEGSETMASRVQCRYGQGKMYIHVLLGGVDPENFPGGEGGGGPLLPLGGFYLLVPRLIFGNISELIWCKSEFSETGIFTSQGFLICIAPHKPLANIGEKEKEGVDFLTPMTYSQTFIKQYSLLHGNSC